VDEQNESPRKAHKEVEEEDSEEEEEDIDYEKDEEEKVITNRYIVDVIARYEEQKDQLVLHWGVGRKVANEWVAAEDKFLPQGSKRWPDGKACQTKFKVEQGNPNFRDVHLDFKWIQDQEPPIRSISFVLLEQEKN